MPRLLVRKIPRFLFLCFVDMDMWVWARSVMCVVNDVNNEVERTSQKSPLWEWYTVVKYQGFFTQCHKTPIKKNWNRTSNSLCDAWVMTEITRAGKRPIFGHTTHGVPHTTRKFFVFNQKESIVWWHLLGRNGLMLFDLYYWTLCSKLFLSCSFSYWLEVTRRVSGLYERQGLKPQRSLPPKTSILPFSIGA